jgi:hypothetical protein
MLIVNVEDKVKKPSHSPFLFLYNKHRILGSDVAPKLSKSF